jgi:K+-transporting ATPase ATPase C chain
MELRRQLLPAVRALVVLTVLCGIAYPLLVLAIGQLAFRHEAEGSLVSADGRVVGSALLGQPFTGDEYLQPRPSAAGDGYDAAASAGANLGPTNPDLLATVADRVDAYRDVNGLGPDVPVPVDAVTASGSGLDPEVSIANAHLQAARIARVRGLPLDAVLGVIDDQVVHRPLGFLGDDGVNVLLVNLALDRLN